MRVFIRSLSLLTLLAVACLLVFAVGKAGADTYDVTASVDFPAPTHPAVITGGIDGTTVANATLTVSGTCEALVPNGVVSIWRDGAPIGSAPCTGTFSLTITLTEVANTFIARSSSVSGLYGPDSSSVTVTLVLPSSPPAPNPTPPSPGATDNTSQNAGAASDLAITPSQPFGTINEEGTVTLLAVVVGGENPYTIYINWGDGSEETRTVDQPGTYQFSHTYAKDGQYLVAGVVRDVLGATSTFNYAVVSKKPAAESVGQTDKASESATAEASNDMWWTALYVSLGLLVAILGYRLGAIRASRAAMASARKKRPIGTRKKKS